MTFDEHSIEAAERFLKTVVVVDERAFGGAPYISTSTKVEDDNDSADAQSTGTPRGDYSTLDADPSLRADETENSQHDLDAIKLVRGFADRGIICSVLKPVGKHDNETRSLAIKSATHADVTILDWTIFGDGGEFAISTMLSLLTSGPAKSLRLIVIYTGDPGINSILDLVKNRLSEEGIKLTKGKSAGGIENSLRGDYLTICALAKFGVHGGAAAGVEDIDYDKLPGRVTAEFSLMTRGLLRNATLWALAILRENANTVLGHIDKSLDAAFVSHRALLDDPEDAQDQIITYLSEEFRSLLVEYSVANHASGEAAVSWLQSEAAGRSIRESGRGVFTLSCLSKIESEAREFEIDDSIVQRIIQMGISKWLANKEEVAEYLPEADVAYLTGRLYSTMTKMLTGQRESALLSDRKFAVFTSLESIYNSEHVPSMSFGTIVLDDEQRYLLCIQPACDCLIQSGRKRAFLFLPFAKVAAHSDNARSDELDIYPPYDTIVPSFDDDAFVHLKLKKHAFECKSIPFTAAGNSARVLATKEGSTVYFWSSESYAGKAKPRKYIWVATLKIRHAQRIINRFAANISRVAIDESEWLRRSAGREE
ncbi:MAG: response regulator receiver domain [Capsulimonadaceae bacterium]